MTNLACGGQLRRRNYLPPELSPVNGGEGKVKERGERDGREGGMNKKGEEG